MNPKVDAYLERAKKWQAEMTRLRAILLDCGLTEELKWGKPCYTFQDANVVLIVGFNEWCSLLLTKGALLDDPEGILVQPTENTQAARQIRFTSLEQIVALEAALKGYVQQAIEVEKAGLKIEFKEITEFALPEELERKFEESPELEVAFRALTPGRQRAYLLHFSQPKQSQTRVSRIEKCAEKILAGKGMNDS